MSTSGIILVAALAIIFIAVHFLADMDAKKRGIK